MKSYHDLFMSITVISDAQTIPLEIWKFSVSGVITRFIWRLVIPFQSQAQRAYMWMNHPRIAREWSSKFGSGGKNLPYHKGEMEGKGKATMNVKPSGTDSRETWKPQLNNVPRIPGMRRDYSMLHPSSSKRFVPRSAPKPNEWEATAQRGVHHLQGSRHHKHNVPVHKPSPLLGRDMRTAFNTEKS